MGKGILLLTGVALSSALWLSTGCGGGGSGGTEQTSTTYTGYFIDAPVEGLEYSTSSGLSGKTGSDGSYKYKSGDNITFKIGKITLGSTKAYSITTPIDLVENGSTTDSKVLNIVAFLLALDDDDNPANGIKIDQNKVPDISATIDLSKNTSLPTEVVSLINSKSAEAQSHIEDSLRDIQNNYIAGSYAGSYTTTDNTGYCDDGGSVNLTINTDGSVNGTAVAAASRATYYVSGNIQYKTLIAGSAIGLDGTAEWRGTWNNNKIEGTWSFSTGGTFRCSGTFSVTKQQ